MNLNHLKAGSMLKRAGLALTLLLTLIGAAPAQRRERTVDNWRPEHYDVSIVLNDQLTEIASAHTNIKAVVLAAKLTKLDLDFGDLPIDSILVGERLARFDRAGSDLLSVTLPQSANRGNEINITVNYHGHPKDGLVLANDRDGKPSATGDNWPNRVHQWIPSLDHPSAKATVTFTITAPTAYTVEANGKFVETKRSDANHAVWRYEESRKIPPYCMVIAVNQGAYLHTPYQAVPLLYLVPKKDSDYAPKGFSAAGPAISFFSQTIAPYPYEKLALIIGATRYGGMENSSAIVFTSTLFDQRSGEFNAPAGSDSRLSRRFGIPTRIESVVAHEIAHQWFGDSVTESTWADLWLSEGFATYFAGLFTEKYDGEDAFRDYMRDAARRYFNFEKQANFPIHDTETKDLMGLLNPNNYDKGAWVLHILRNRLGDEAFFNGLRDYYNAHKEANATTEDLRAALEKSSRKDLKEFLARWVFGAGHPRYQLSWDIKGNVVSVHLNQLQAGEAFLDPVPLEFTIAGQKKIEMIYPRGKSTTATFREKGNPSVIRIDPQETLLREIVTTQ